MSIYWSCDRWQEQQDELGSVWIHTLLTGKCCQIDRSLLDHAAKLLLKIFWFFTVGTFSFTLWSRGVGLQRGNLWTCQKTNTYLKFFNTEKSFCTDKSNNLAKSGTNDVSTSSVRSFFFIRSHGVTNASNMSYILLDVYWLYVFIKMKIN